MADMLSIAVSGLQAFQQALNVTSNNICQFLDAGLQRRERKSCSPDASRFR